MFRTTKKSHFCSFLNPVMWTKNESLLWKLFAHCTTPSVTVAYFLWLKQCHLANCHIISTHAIFWTNVTKIYFFACQVKNLLDQYDTNKLDQVTLPQFKVSLNHHCHWSHLNFEYLQHYLNNSHMSRWSLIRWWCLTWRRQGGERFNQKRLSSRKQYILN